MEIGGCVNLFTNSSVWEGEQGCLGELLQATRSVHLLQRRCAWGCPGRGEPGPTDDALSPGASQMTPCPLCLFNLQKKSPRSPLPRVRYLGVQCIFFFLGKGWRRRVILFVCCEYNRLNLKSQWRQSHSNQITIFSSKYHQLLYLILRGWFLI